MLFDLSSCLNERNPLPHVPYRHVFFRESEIEFEVWGRVPRHCHFMIWHEKRNGIECVHFKMCSRQLHLLRSVYIQYQHGSGINFSKCYLCSQISGEYIGLKWWGCAERFELFHRLSGKQLCRRYGWWKMQLLRMGGVYTDLISFLTMQWYPNTLQQVSYCCSRSNVDTKISSCIWLSVKWLNYFPESIRLQRWSSALRTCFWSFSQSVATSTGEFTSISWQQYWGAALLGLYKRLATIVSQ